MAKMGKAETDKFKDGLKAIVDINSKRLLDSEKANLSNHLAYVESHQKEVNNYLTRAADSSAKIKKLSSTSDDSGIVSTLEKVVASPFWEFMSFYSDTVYIQNKEPIIMKQINPSAGVNRQVDLGYFKFALQPFKARISATPLKDNVQALYGSRPVFHPFIGPDGAICWGTGSNLAAKMLTNFEFDKLFEMLAALLTSQEPGAYPYTDLYHFEVERNKPICKYCTQKEDGCHCTRCPFCTLKEKECKCSLRVCVACCRKVVMGQTCENCTCIVCKQENGHNCDCCSECETKGNEGHKDFCSEYEDPEQEEPEEEEEEEEEVSANPAIPQAVSPQAGSYAISFNLDGTPQADRSPFPGLPSWHESEDIQRPTYANPFENPEIAQLIGQGAFVDTVSMTISMPGGAMLRIDQSYNIVR